MKEKAKPFKFRCLLKDYSSRNVTSNYITFIKDITHLLKIRKIDLSEFFKSAKINVSSKPDLSTYEGRWIRIDKNLYMPIKTNTKSKRKNVIAICNAAGIELKNLRGETYNYNFWNNKKS